MVKKEWCSNHSCGQCGVEGEVPSLAKGETKTIDTGSRKVIVDDPNQIRNYLEFRGIKVDNLPERITWDEVTTETVSFLLCEARNSKNKQKRCNFYNQSSL